MITIAQAAEHWGWRAAELVGNLALPVAAIWIAYKGLDTWRSQLRVQAEYELARRLMRAALRLKDAIIAARVPVSEEAQPVTVKIGSAGGTIHTRDVDRETFRARWERAEDSMNDLYLESMDADVVWGKAADDRIAPLRKHYFDLLNDMEDYFKERSRPGASKEVVSELRRKAFCCTSKGPDEFETALNKAVDELRVFITPAVEAVHRESERD
jgi:hypothetical protein